MTLSGLEEWLAKREKAIETQQEVRAAEQDVRAAVEDGKEAALKLSKALKTVGVLARSQRKDSTLFSRLDGRLWINMPSEE
jgi:predicted DNA-binding ArsR family transcriptional regulator